MKFFALGLAVIMLVSSTEAVAIREDKLDDATKKSVKRAAAAALKVAVAAKKAEAAENIRSDMKEVNKAETREQSDAISEAVEKTSKEEEKRAVEKAVAHVEKIRQQKLVVHQNALKEIAKIKSTAQAKHDAINAETKKETDSAIAKAQKGVTGLDSKQEEADK